MILSHVFCSEGGCQALINVCVTLVLARIALIYLLLAHTVSLLYLLAWFLPFSLCSLSGCLSSSSDNNKVLRAVLIFFCLALLNTKPLFSRYLGVPIFEIWFQVFLNVLWQFLSWQKIGCREVLQCRAPTCSGNCNPREAGPGNSARMSLYFKQINERVGKQKHGKCFYCNFSTWNTIANCLGLAK